MANDPGAWSPYSKDCSQGYCSYYCPQWCFFLFPPPPPSPPSSRPLLSPLLIAIITVASTAFVLVTYYLIVARYRRRQLLITRPLESPPDNPLSHVAHPGGLDETLISKIASYQYRANDGLVLSASDCSVCLSEFEDGDHIRLLPKCNHAFHRHCIDTWLKSHCNCPLCRAGIFPLPTAACAVIVEEFGDSDPEEMTSVNVNFTNDNVNFTDDNVIEIREGRAVTGRSLSMDSPFRRRTDMNTDTDTGMNAEYSTRWSRTLYTVLISPVARMKRSRSLRTTLPT